jgi:hypothetical protein
MLYVKQKRTNMYGRNEKIINRLKPFGKAFYPAAAGPETNGRGFARQ